MSSCRFLQHHQCCHLVWLYYECREINPQILGSCDYMRLKLFVSNKFMFSFYGCIEELKCRTYMWVQILNLKLK